MIQNKIVVRYQDGKTLKGHTSDFLPAKPTFHITLDEAAPETAPLEVPVSGIKAVFFVKDFAGDPEHKKTNDFTAGKSVGGRKIKVKFKDGETLVGTTQGYDPKRVGFFVVPADADSNNERCFVVAGATQGVSFI
ncbi:MAG: hypothetical protein JW944_06035 [Deltaproteobacteria bacterium]|nr:hypothetical protein [Deltaproteobacteria bacterium]